jgi:hypothetical protein
MCNMSSLWSLRNLISGTAALSARADRHVTVPACIVVLRCALLRLFCCWKVVCDKL